MPEDGSSVCRTSGLVHLQYGYDRASNRTNLIAQFYDKDFDELNEYDGMHRLKEFHRGRLIESDTVIESLTLQEGILSAVRLKWFGHLSKVWLGANDFD